MRLIAQQAIFRISEVLSRGIWRHRRREVARETSPHACRKRPREQRRRPRRGQEPHQQEPHQHLVALFLHTIRPGNPRRGHLQEHRASPQDLAQEGQHQWQKSSTKRRSTPNSVVALMPWCNRPVLSLAKRAERGTPRPWVAVIGFWVMPVA